MLSKNSSCSGRGSTPSASADARSACAVPEQCLILHARFHAMHKLGRRDIQNHGQFEDCPQGRHIASSLQEADVGAPVDADAER
jgi:hypothetical protein